MEAQALDGAVVDEHEDRRRGLRAVKVDVPSMPHISSGRSVVIVPSWVRGPRGLPTRVGASRPALPHQAQHARLGRAHALGTQPGPDLAMTLAHPFRGRQHVTDPDEQLLVATTRLWTALAGHDGRSRRSRAAYTVERVTSHPTHPSDPVRPASRGGEGHAHRLRLGHKKGFSSSIRCAALEQQLVGHRDLAHLRPQPRISSSRSSAGRLFKLASPPARNWSRQPASVPAVTPIARDTASSVSPRSTRSTASRLRREENRPPSPARRAGSPTLALRAPFGEPATAPGFFLGICSSSGDSSPSQMSKETLGRWTDEEE